MKSVDYTYIHMHKQNFIRIITNGEFAIDFGGLQQEIQKQYVDMFHRAQQHSLDIKSTYPAAKEIMSFVATGDQLGTLLESHLNLEDDPTLDVKIRQASIDVMNKKILEDLRKAESSTEELDKLLKNIEGIILDFNKLDANLLDYYSTLDKKSSQKQSMDLSFMNTKGLAILNINKTALQSLNSLANRVASIRTAEASGKVNSKTIINYVNSKGESVSVPISQVVYSLRQLLINTLGGLGEGLTALRIIKESDKIVDQIKKSVPGASITVSGEGTSKLASGKVSKSDINITYSDERVSLSMGISAKAQYHRGKSTVTTFQTSKLKEFVKDSVLQSVQYQFLNNLYHNRISINDQLIMNRYIAALNFDNAVTGINIGDNVMFLSYLDEIISVEDFYKSILSKGKDIKRLPSLSILGKQKTITKQEESESFENESNIERSQRIRELLLSLKTQIQFKING